MTWLLIYLIIHLISTILAQKQMIFILNEMEKQDGYVLYFGSFDKSFNDKIIKTIINLTPHIPLINFFFAYHFIKRKYYTFLIKINKQKKQKP